MQYISLLAGLVGGAFAVVAGSYIVHFLTHDRWWREYRLKKLEELHMSVFEHVQHLQNAFFSVVHNLNSSKEFGTLKRVDMTLKPFAEAFQGDKNLPKLGMITDLYFEALKVPLEDLRGAERAFTSVLETLVRAAVANEKWNADSDAALQEFHRRVKEEFRPAVLALQERLFEAIQSTAKAIKSERPWPVNLLAQVWNSLTRG